MVLGSAGQSGLSCGSKQGESLSSTHIIGDVPADGLLRRGGEGGGEPIRQNWLVPGSNPSFFLLAPPCSYELNISTSRQSNHLRFSVFACTRNNFHMWFYRQKNNSLPQACLHGISVSEEEIIAMFSALDRHRQTSVL